MSNLELNNTVTELLKYRAMKEDLEAVIEGLQDQLKAHMTEAGLETLTCSTATLTYKDVTSTRLDSTALKKELPEVAARYSVTTSAKRFTVKA